MTLELAAQPEFRHPPISLDGSRRHFEDFCRLIDVQPPEVAELHHATLTRVLRFELREGLVQAEDFDVESLRDGVALGQGDARPSATFGRPSLSRVLD